MFSVKCLEDMKNNNIFCKLIITITTMRKTLLTLLLTVPMLSFSQNGYKPFLEEGKVWSSMWKYPAGEVEYKVEVKGDTVLLGKKCKIVQIKLAGEIQGDMYYYEEYGKLYLYRGDDTFWLIYDLSLTETGWHNEFEIHPIYIYDIKKSYISVNGQERLCMIVDYDMDNEHGDDPAQEIWIEGIGRLGRTPLMSFNAYNEGTGKGYFNYCSLNGEMLFTQEGYNQITNIQSAINEYSSDNRQDTYDLQGRKVIKPQKNGLYIKNGKKFIAR